MTAGTLERVAGYETNPVTRRRRRRLPPGWPILACLVLYGLWYVLGLGAFIWVIVALPIFANQVMRHRWRVPRGIVIWLFFLGWVLLSAIMIHKSTNWLTYGYRFTSYLAATLAFLQMVNTSEKELPTDRVLKALTIFFVTIVIGGLAAMAAPAFSFPTPTGMLLGGLAHNKLLGALVHPRLAQAQALGGVQAIGHAISRPAAPFAYTNWWGGNYAVLVPFVVIYWRRLTSRRNQLILGVILVVSLVPFIYSINRGAWLSLIAAGVYAWARYAIRNGGRALIGGMVLAAVLGLALVSPLGSVVQARLGHSGSASLRLSLDQQAGASALHSPVVGYGVPLPQPVSQYSLPNVGTQGQIWLVLVSVGLPGTFFFLAWLLYVFWASRSTDDPVTFSVHLAILMGFIQMPFYGWMPTEMFLLMALAGLVWRQGDRLVPQSRPLTAAQPGSAASQQG